MRLGGALARNPENLLAIQPPPIDQEVLMVVITGVVLIVLLAGLFFLFRAMGSMGQAPSPRERMRHTSEEGQHHEPRASGLN